MAALDTTKPRQQEKVPAGTVLYQAGAPAGALTILHQGEVAALNKFYQGRGARRMYALGANSVVGFSSLLSGQPLSCHYVTTKESVVSSFPARGAFQQLILGKLNVGLMAVRSLMQEAMAAQQGVRSHAALLSQIVKATDNLALAYYKCNPQPFQAGEEAVGDAIDPVVSAGRVVVNDFEQNGGQFPQHFNQIWLQSDHSGILRKNYDFESSFDPEDFGFYRRLLQLPVNIQGAIFKTDIKILESMSRKLGSVVDENIQEIYQLQESVDVSLESLVQGDYCYAEKFYLLSDLIGQGWNALPLAEFSNILKFLVQGTDAFLRNYQQLQGVPFGDVTPSLEKLREFLSNEEVQEIEEQKQHVEEAGANIDAIKSDLEGSAGKIMGFLQLPADEQKQMFQLLKSLKAQNNPLDSSGDPRKIRRQIGQIYWKLYEKAFYRFQESSGNVPQPVKLMLYYGFFDEEFLDDEHLKYLYNREDATRARYPIWSITDWLQRVRTAEELPSVDEMGMGYFDGIKQEFKDRGFKKITDVPDDINTPERRLHHEINKFLEVNTRLTSGTPTASFPILTRYQITMDLDKSHVTFESLSEALDELLGKDYSAFHREVILNDEEREIFKEFVMRQVIPNFIIVPSIGTKIMMWQDTSGRSNYKSSRGRIAVPVFATADLFTLLLEAVAAFRWELTKTIMGPDWNNVSQSSITADYTDYVQFYKKNRELSPEIKEKLSSEFKRFRTDRDRFTNDYINWIRYESEGVMKLNKVARNIFYRHVPFAKDIRDNLSNQPAYSEIHNRFKNIRAKKQRELEVRYRKYGEQLPEELQATMDFYKV